ncbi:MAG: murein biosynthesis integral membrane protein MurJ [Brevinema sp.]
MKKSYIPLKNTLISSFGTFLSRITGVIKFNVVNYLFGAGADTFYSANTSILSLRKVLGEGSLVSAYIPISNKNRDKIDTELFTSNIINQVIIISTLITGIGIFMASWWTQTFLPGFANRPQAFQEIVQLTVIMLSSTIFFSIFSIIMGILNANEKFIASSTAPVLANIIFIIFPILTYQQLGILSLAWAVVLGSVIQCIAEIIELYLSGFRYHFYLNFFDQYTISFWKLFFPTALNYLALAGIPIGLGYFTSFLPPGSLTYLRNANTIMNAPVGFVGVAIAGAIFPVFSKVKHDLNQLAEAWTQGVVFFLFVSIPIALFFLIYPDVIVNLIFRDISRFVSGSTGQFTLDLLIQTTNAVQILSTILIPWSLTVMVGKLFYSLEKPHFSLILILVNFIINIFGYFLSRAFQWGGTGLVYSDLISGWFTLITSFVLIAFILPAVKKHHSSLLKYATIFTIISTIIWLGCRPIYYWYLSFDSPLILLILGSILFVLGMSIFFGIAHLCQLNPITNRKKLNI